MSQPLISVIIPVYNAADTLGDCLDSLRRQTLGFERLEVVFADDCSTDRSWELLSGWQEEYENVKAVRLKRNSGYGGAPRNAALGLASGKYVMFLDSDDLYQPGACQALCEAMERGGCDIVSFDYAPFTGRPLRREKKGSQLKAGLYDLTVPMVGTAPFFAGFCCKIYRRELIESMGLGFAEGVACEDTMFLYSYIMFCCKKGLWLDRCLLNYRLHPNSAYHNKSMSYFTSLPRSFMQALPRFSGREDFLAAILSSVPLLNEYADDLLASSLEGDELEGVFSEWSPVFKFCAARGVELSSPVARILARRLEGDDLAGAVEALGELRETAALRRAQLDDIFSSRTWKLARVIQRILAPLRGGD